MSSGCGCKEVYSFPHITHPYYYIPLASVLFCSSIPTFCSFLNIYNIHCKVYAFPADL